MATEKREFVKCDESKVWHLANHAALGLRCHASQEVQERVRFRVVRYISTPPRPMCLRCSRYLDAIEEKCVKAFG